MIKEISNKEFLDTETGITVHFSHRDLVTFYKDDWSFSWGREGALSPAGVDGSLVYPSPEVKFDKGDRKDQEIGQVAERDAKSALERAADHKGYFVKFL